MKTVRWTGSDAGVEPPEPISKLAHETAAGEADHAVAWLLCDPLPPVPIGTKPVIILGRSRECDMILAHESVSRRHVAIRALGDKILLEDQSTYGTTVNGERVSSATLSAGDVITMGPYLITVRLSPAEHKEESALTRPFRVRSASSEAMGGRLEKVPLPEVLQQIEFNKKTGTLRVFDDLDTVDGTLVIYEGSPVYAELGDRKDADAVFQMLALERGTFSFVSKIEAGERTMHGSLTGLLLEAGRMLDEGPSPEE